MNIGAVANVIGTLLLMLAGAMSAPLAVTLWYREADFSAFVFSILITLAIGGAIKVGTRRFAQDLIGHREAFAVVALGWTFAGIFGGLPFLLQETPLDPIDALFESLSGFTTTGASVLTQIEGLPHGILFWRSLTHWLGGMGIIVLVVAVLPFLGVGGMQLLKAEVPGPLTDRLHPRVSHTAKSLWGVYALLSGIEVVLLMFGDMNLYESLCHTFGTMATGGFSTRDASIGSYGSVYIEVVIIVFMFLAGVNFSLHFRALKGTPNCYFKDRQFQIYAGLTLAAMLGLTFLTTSTYDSWGTALRHSAFQTVAILTTTGYATADFDQWVPAARVLLVFLMIIGGCAGSTGGGVKVIRAMVFLKSGLREIRRLIHPRALLPLKIGGQPVKPDVVQGVMAFFALYSLCFIIATLIMTCLVPDLVTAVSSVVATLGNIGPGLGGVGPAQNYAAIPGVGKLVLCLCMLLGRLEIYTVLILFSRECWRK